MADQLVSPADLLVELKHLRRVGLFRIRQHLDTLPALAEIARQTHGAAEPTHIEEVLREAWQRLGDGPHGQAVGILFGLEQGHRGGSPATLRSKAADRLGYFSVDTFRKKPEADVMDSFAEQLLALRVRQNLMERPGMDRVAAVVEAIEALTTIESAELARRLRTRFGQQTDS